MTAHLWAMRAYPPTPDGGDDDYPITCPTCWRHLPCRHCTIADPDNGDGETNTHTEETDNAIGHP